MRKYFALILTVTMLMTTCVPMAFAESQESTIRASDLIASYSITISCNDDGLITATASLRANKSIEKLGFPVIRIERKDNSTWTPVAIAENKYKYSATRYSYSITCQGTTGKEYYAYAEFYTKDGVKTDARDKMSETITCR